MLVLNRPFGVIRLSDGARVGEKLDSKLAIVDVTVYGCSNQQILSIADNIWVYSNGSYLDMEIRLEI